MDKFDSVTAFLIKHKIPLTQKNWIEAAYFGDKSSLEELGGEERADLPEGFEDWPIDEVLVN
jgi:hypothetical protein